MDFAAERTRLINQLGFEINDQRVLEAMGRIPRERFVPATYQSGSYLDEPLPIGNEQTISQPLIVAMMTQALELQGKEKVLEIGTGSGYQTAILAELSREVISVERIPVLAETARKLLRSLGYSNIKIFQASDELGWPAEAPYEGIIVTAGAPRVPDSLLAQLSYGGRMVIPVGSRYAQELYQVIKTRDGNVVHNLGGCRFVPLIAKDAWPEE